MAFAEPPKLTFPPEVAERVRAAYAAAETILEYGSGGSTLLAAELGRRCVSVESDGAWATAMRDWIARAHPEAPVRIHRAYIGSTKAWGRPRSSLRWLRYPLFWRYPRSVWSLPGFAHPDVILIDGRFRLACFLTALTKIRRPTKVLWDDYTTRPAYALAERYAKPTAVVGRMAEFEITPRPFSAGELWALRHALFDPE